MSLVGDDRLADGLQVGAMIPTVIDHDVDAARARNRNPATVCSGGGFVLAWSSPRRDDEGGGGDMASKSTRAVTAGSIVVVLSVSSSCGGDETSTPASSLDSTSATTATTQSSLLPASTTTTTTTTPGAGQGIPPTAPTFPPDDRVPETLTVRFDESYVCQLGPAGESDIHASGAIVAEVDVSPDLDEGGYPVTGEGDLSVTGFLRGGDLCTGDAVGTHRVRLDGTIEVPLEGAPRLELLVTGTWYEAWDGEISCAAGLPMSGPWEWPAESNEETLVFSPMEHGAVWAKSVTYGLCEGTVERTLEL